MAKQRILKSRLIPVYSAPNKSNVAHTRERSGCYIIYEDGIPVYIGYSSNNLYRTLLRHFQKWNNAQTFLGYLGLQSHQVTYHGNDMDRYKVRLILCTPGRAERLEKMLIHKYLPRDNKAKYQDHTPTNTDIDLMNEFTKARVSDIEEAPF